MRNKYYLPVNIITLPGYQRIAPVRDVLHIKLCLCCSTEYFVYYLYSDNVCQCNSYRLNRIAQYEM